MAAHALPLELADPAMCPPLATLLGTSRAMVALRAFVARVAPLQAPVLLLGETGTGKEVVARALAAAGRPATAPWVAVNCGGSRGELLAAELFGHERGAFTGAIERRLGAFEQAHGGTLFLDELGELPLSQQPLLLRALESGEVRRLGAARACHVRPRLVAATHCGLAAAVRDGTFRADLFYRLHVLVARLPALRHRPEDVPLLARHFLAHDAPDPTAPPFSLSAAALLRLQRHRWPGNVRELRHVLQRAMALARGPHLDAGDLCFGALGHRTRPRRRTLEALEAAAIDAELRRQRGNRSAAAIALGVSRATLHRRLAARRAAASAIKVDGRTPAPATATAAATAVNAAADGFRSE